jgi:hypothetical protein
MPHRPSHRLIDLWVVLGAAVATIGTAFLRPERGEVTMRVGFENPIVRVLAIWAAAIGVQFACWWIWTTLRRTVSR